MLNLALVVVSVAFAAGIVRTLLVKHPLPGPPTIRAAGVPPPSAAAETGDRSPAAYAAIAAQNLFNPARSETATAAVAVAKPVLHGVVINGPKSRAFLEDPTAKRVVGYSVGDAVGGGKIERIADDRVVITRPEGSMEVLLQDPSKPRPAPVVAAAPAQAAPAQGAPGQPAPQQALPAQIAPPPPGQVQGPSPRIGAAPSGPPPIQAPGGLPMLRRRIGPQGQTTE